MHEDYEGEMRQRLYRIEWQTFIANLWLARIEQLVRDGNAEAIKDLTANLRDVRKGLEKDVKDHTPK